jgi:hypothetical protein
MFLAISSFTSSFRASFGSPNLVIHEVPNRSDADGLEPGFTLRHLSINDLASPEI